MAAARNFSSVVPGCVGFRSKRCRARHAAGRGAHLAGCCDRSCRDGPGGELPGNGRFDRRRHGSRPRHRQQHDGDQGHRLGRAWPGGGGRAGGGADDQPAAGLVRAGARALVDGAGRGAAGPLQGGRSVPGGMRSPSPTSARPWASWPRTGARCIRASSGWTSAARPRCARLSDRVGAQRLLELTGKVPDHHGRPLRHRLGRPQRPRRSRRDALDRRRPRLPRAPAHRRADDQLRQRRPARDLRHLGAMTLSPEVHRGRSAPGSSSSSSLVRPAAVIGKVSRAAAEATGLRAGTVVVAGGGDGQAGGLGTAIIERGSAYVNLGTAAVSAGVERGLSHRPRLPHAHRPVRLRLHPTSSACAPAPSSPTGLVTRLFGHDPQAEPAASTTRLEAEAAAVRPIGAGRPPAPALLERGA